MDPSFVGLNGSEVQYLKPQSESAFHNFFPIILLSEPPNQGSVHLCSVMAPLSMKMNLNGVQATQKIRNFTAVRRFPAFPDAVELPIQFWRTLSTGMWKPSSISLIPRRNRDFPFQASRDR
jgi:hypothetical protein